MHAHQYICAHSLVDKLTLVALGEGLGEAFLLDSGRILAASHTHDGISGHQGLQLLLCPVLRAGRAQGDLDESAAGMPLI